MKSKLLAISMIILLLISTVVLSGCNKINENTEDLKEDNKAMVDYTFKDLSFKLPQDFTKRDGENTDTVIYNTEVVNGKLKIFSVATVPSEGVDFIETAATSLGDYGFELSGYDLTSKSETKLEEINGMKTVSVVVNYHSDSVNGDAVVEYCYAQKDDTVYVICCEIFTQNGQQVETNEFEETFKDVKSSIKLL